MPGQSYYVLRYRAIVQFPGHILRRKELLDVRGPLSALAITGWTRRDEGFGPPPWRTERERLDYHPVLYAVVPPALSKGRLSRCLYGPKDARYCCHCPRRLLCCQRRCP